MNGSVHGFMAGACLDQTAVFETVDSDPGRRISRLSRRFYVGDCPLGRDPPEGAFLAGNGISAPVA
ncbi:hypothetical protein D3C81_2300080 [compost metagenome]